MEVDEITISAAIEHLNEGEMDRFEATQIKERIKNIYEITEEESEKIYKIWRSKYLNKNKQ
ncbi:MAG: hypothetical protein E7D27_16200 [Clostridium celatum]|nr:hypothetical protein [Clostridium celatum]